MPRRPEFDRAQVIGAAMRVFWEKGYQGASMAALSGAMGLKPGSIYAAFGSKDQLFAEVVRAYTHRLRQLAAAAGVGPRKLIELWFATHITAALEGSSEVGRGCLVLNSASELPNLGAAGRAQVDHELERLQAFFTTLIAAARGGVAGGRADEATTARLLVAALAGIATLSRAGQGREALEAVATGALAAV